MATKTIAPGPDNMTKTQYIYFSYSMHYIYYFNHNMSLNPVMKTRLQYLPTLVTVAAILAMLAYGPIPQLDHYHDFADSRSWLGIPNAWNVLSNLPFLMVGIWGWVILGPQRRDPALVAGWAGWELFLAGLVLTAAGSSWYHLAPDNARLIWDRLPIALACAGLLAGVRGETREVTDQALGWPTWAWAAGLAVFGIAGVLWWVYTDSQGHGDLRPYLLLQGLPLMLIPLWQWLGGSPRPDKLAFGAAIGLYALAKAAELSDGWLLAATGGWISGHAIKHLLAAAASAVVVARLIKRTAA